MTERPWVLVVGGVLQGGPVIGDFPSAQAARAYATEYYPGEKVTVTQRQPPKPAHPRLVRGSSVDGPG